MTTIVVNNPSIFDNYNPGDRVYLVSWFDESTPKHEQYRVQSEIPVTNQGVERAEGWLGSTNNINQSSHGLHEIESLEVVTRPSKELIAGKQRPEPIGTKIELSPITH